MAVSSLVSALIAWAVGGLGSCALFFLFAPASICTWIVFLAASIVAVATGYAGRNQIRESHGAETGEGMTTAGLILGWIGIVVSILVICILPLLALSGLALLGPQIGNVFSQIEQGLTTPVP